jgi:hypothetical protein
MIRNTELDSQTYSDSSMLPPNNAVSAATLATVPAVGTVSSSLNAGVSAAMIGSAASQAAAVYPSAISTGTGIGTDASGQLNAIIGKLGKTPQQLEAAGILKPGSAALVTGLVQQGMNVKSAMTNNLFTGMPGAENLQAYINNTSAQATAQLINFQQAQTAMSMVGAISGTEAPGAISGIINAASQVGIKSTVAFLQNSSKTRGTF